MEIETTQQEVNHEHHSSQIATTDDIAKGLVSSIIQKDKENEIENEDDKETSDESDTDSVSNKTMINLSQEKLRHMGIDKAIEIRNIDESASMLLFAGYTLNSYGLRMNTGRVAGNRLRVDMTDFTGTETITVWMYSDVAEKISQQFARGKWIKLFGFEVVPIVPKYDRGTWRYSLKITTSTIIEEFNHEPPQLNLLVPTMSIAEFSKLHKGRESVGSVEAVMIKATQLLHNSAEITIADNADAEGSLSVKFFESSMDIFREMLTEFLTGIAPNRCFINLQGDGIFKRANVSGMTIVTRVASNSKNKYLSALYRAIGTSCTRVPGWFEIDKLRPMLIHTVCSSCSTSVTRRIDKDTAACSSCNYVGPVKQLLSLKGILHMQETTKNVSIPSYMLDVLYKFKSPFLTCWNKNSTKTKKKMIMNPPHGSFLLGESDDIIAFASSTPVKHIQ
ncbi:hypothetical protein SELMODRAFT_428757 [Selaginella moellendorffii]|uniref:Uncharacterized protein n=1 Tax=Selaginella moellendorffii TaxID=88036 RepID=D8T3W3_SELML|nr:hypothetical protein SELMODRAFT_428757 [Selaginella moellendorffii]